jgi:hypothetical protein
MARKVINPKSVGSLKLATTEAGLNSGFVLNEQVTSFKVVPSANRSTIPATFGAPAAESFAASSWAVEISYLQDWGKSLSMSEYLHGADGDLLYFRFDPAGTAEPGFQGLCYVMAGAYGGPADQNWEDTASWPCPEQPQILPAS